jgi:signal transduction histidine kinase
MRRWWIRATSYLAVWTALGLFFSGQIYLDHAYADRPVSWPQAIYLGLAEWYVWALLSPLILCVARRFPFERGSRVKSLAVHLPVTLFVTLLKLALYSPLFDASGVERLRSSGMDAFNASLLTSWLLVGFSHALVHYQSSQARMHKALELEARLTRTQLQLLKAQLQPHFLFNTLHSIAALMHRDVPAAETMLVRLSDLLRMALDHGDQQEVPLKTELEFTRLYVKIQEVRFRDRLDVSFDIAPETLDARCPTMILQPLVENAIRHGVEQTAKIGSVAIEAATRDGALEISVRDDGPGLSERYPDRAGGGIGLANSRARLEKLYGDRQGLTLEERDGGGLVVRLTLPFVRHSERTGIGEQPS